MRGSSPRYSSSGRNKCNPQFSGYSLLSVLCLVLALSASCNAAAGVVYNCSYNPSDLWDEGNFRCLHYQMIANETELSFGSKIVLDDNEEDANYLIMHLKECEMMEGMENEHLFLAANHIFKGVDRIKGSPLFQLLKEMPKGGVLHAHDTALVNTEYLVDLIKRNVTNLWACTTNDSRVLKMMRFSYQQPTYNPFQLNCVWESMSAVRQKMGDTADQQIRSHFTLYPQTDYLDINAVWKKFMDIFILLDGLVTYRLVWGDYFYHSLKDYYADGIQYIEIRSVLPTLYDMEDRVYTEIDTVAVYNDTLNRFMADHDDFIGAKLIYAPIRGVDIEQFEGYMAIYKEIKTLFPNFVIGFDLVAQEDLGKPLKYFAEKLLQMEDVNFYFHAGETNWYGTDVDENLIDAVALGAKRIGHGYALVKHPVVMEAVKQRQIAIEVNPISNQVLELVSDLRNHPAAPLFARDFPLVISSDDPSFWKTAPLTHDFYVAFVGISSARSDLRFLKQLAENSINFSGMNDDEKKIAMDKWTVKWNNFTAVLRNHYVPSTGCPLSRV